MPALRERVGILGFAAGQALRGVDHQGANLRTHLERIIVRAGHKVWPRLFPNLRASCATDLLTAVENGGAGWYRSPLRAWGVAVGSVPLLARWTARPSRTLQSTPVP